jgi:hypothetical protein
MNAAYRSALLATFAALAACAQSDPNNSSLPTVASHSTTSDKPIGLAINGFNYTDRVISMFSINNQGGGNILVSSPTTGGGKTTCCMTWYPGSKLSRSVKIKWMRDIDGEEIWCKKEVALQAPFPANPKNVAIHFMPDGNIEVELTERFPTLKLSLNRFDAAHRKETANLINDETTADCHHGEQQVP